jgi:DNA adenine methylase
MQERNLIINILPMLFGIFRVEKYKMKILVPPIKSQGIKTKLVNTIKDCLVWNNEGRWIEPFVGTGVVGFNVRPNQALFADTNPHLINFYNNIKSNRINSVIVREFLTGESEILKERGGEYYYEVRERFNNNFDSLDFIFLNRSCFNGVMRFNQKGKFNVPFCKKTERFSKSYITKIVNQVENIQKLINNYDWEFRVQDYITTIGNANPNDFIYCDPPYVDRHVDYFNSWNEDDEEKLFLLLANCPGKFILSTWHSNKYRVNKYIEKYWNSFFIITKEHFYHVGASENNRNSMLEALVLNYRPDPDQIQIQNESEQLILLEPKAPYQRLSYVQ